MNKLIAIAVAALFFAAAIPSAEASREDHVNYMPSLVVVTISCSGDQHTWIPHDPTSPWEDNPDGWAFSGEPECAPSDLMNTAQGTNNPSGFGGGAFYVFPGTDSLAVVNTDDAAFGVGNSFQTVTSPHVQVDEETTEPYETSEGCGPQAVAISPDSLPHWQAPADDPYYLVWSAIPEVGVTDDLNVCFASVGVVSAIIS